MTTKNVREALVKAQAAAPAALAKLDWNDFAKFDYVSADRMIIAGRDVLSEHGLALVPVAQEWREGFGDSAATMKTTFHLVHGESGEHLELVFETAVCTKKGTPADKAGFGAATESLGYMYRGLLSIGRVDPREIQDISGRDDRDYEPPRQSEPRATTADTAKGARQVLDALNDNGASQLAEEYVQSIAALAAKPPSREVLEELEAIPPAVKRLDIPGADYRRIVDAYNPVVAHVRDHLGVPA